jgi:hypothetical protein
MLDAMYVAAGIVLGLLWIAVCGVMAYRNRANKTKFHLWLKLSGIGLLPIVLSLLRRSGTQNGVIEVKPHERTKAPTADEQAKVDVKTEVVEEKAKELQDQSAVVDQKSEELDAKKEQLDAEVKKTDQEIANAQSSHDVSPTERKPDPAISNKLRTGG